MIPHRIIRRIKIIQMKNEVIKLKIEKKYTNENFQTTSDLWLGKSKIAGTGFWSRNHG